MPFTTAVKNTMLDSITPTQCSLHSGAPGAAGTANEVTGGGYSRQSATFAAASGAARALSVAVDFTTPALQPVTYFGVWAGATFLGSGQITSGDVAANAAGAYQLSTSTQLTLSDS